MSVCDVHVPGGFPDLPTFSELQGVLDSLQSAARELHIDVEGKLLELDEALKGARAAGIVMQHSGFLDNPVVGWLGQQLVNAVDGVYPQVRELSQDLDTIFEGLEIAAQGAGNPDRVAAVAEALRVGVKNSLESLADGVAISELSTSSGWESPAAGKYFARADNQSTKGMRPLAVAVAEIADALDAYAVSQVEYAEELDGFWTSLKLSLLSLSFTVVSVTSLILSLVADGGAVTPLDAVSLLSIIGTIGGAVATVFPASSLIDAGRALRDAPMGECDELFASLEASKDAVGFDWPLFAQEQGA